METKTKYMFIINHSISGCREESARTSGRLLQKFKDR